MKKLSIAIAIMACVSFCFADAPSAKVAQAASVTATGLAYTNDTDYAAVGYKEIEKLAYENDSAVTCTFVTYVLDGGIETTINSSTVTAGSSAVVYPVRNVTETSYGWVGTSDTVHYVTNTVTRQLTYPAQYVRTIATLAGTNGAATANALKFTVYGK